MCSKNPWREIATLTKEEQFVVSVVGRGRTGQTDATMRNMTTQWQRNFTVEVARKKRPISQILSKKSNLFLSSLPQFSRSLEKKSLEDGKGGGERGKKG